MGQSPRTPGDVRSNIMSRSSQIRISLEYEGRSRRLRIFRTPLKKELCMISLRGSLFAIALPAELEAQRLNWEVYNCQDLMQVAAAPLLAWADRKSKRMNSSH